MIGCERHPPPPPGSPGSPAPRRALLLLLAAFCIAAAPWGLAVASESAPSATYKIELFSPESWTHYYALIGLGNVDPRPLSKAEKEGLQAHCRELEKLTDYIWHPLGYSYELGYKLCYRTGPFAESDAVVLCQRLEMGVRENSPRLILCGN